ncbi:LURP-one-related/scramblase family protein [Bifidobacterium subtile]|jgi:uncharacterized protein YxjI|uniref:LURP-one-related family protein n=1 Tax=Bifidobacterium subtile TaxID=77635 RepID=A0A087E5P8_9BIFI|nr:LURP-one-related family protein [Bifidobacterium subtile]KFJ03099.1 hypothetical protein BISU_1030 [Bifidobacterium subtile]MCI1222413.1 LURP-one-related family protein [Bifidobacterium subtile]MCI1241009.1 LURP-one-related family protein [Bifidobacterium subtile]MCI1257895.1 LURP-one-related family protein [Bifidobacterium subtile]QOL37359.1 LURP-one-related family protein [Bifidobacterium subtile]
MQQLYIKQQVFTLAEHFTVADAGGNVRYRVEGSFLRIPKSFSITDPFGVEVARLEKTVFSLLPHFSVFVGGMQVASIDKELSLFRPRYRIDAAGLNVQGDWWDMEFSASRAGVEVARISKRWLSWGDSYEITVFDDALETLIVALVVAIDKVKNDENSSASA